MFDWSKTETNTRLKKGKCQVIGRNESLLENNLSSSFSLTSGKLGCSGGAQTGWPGPDGYPRVLDYSIFEFTTLPYSKNFTTQSSSRVVTISSYLSDHSNIQKMEMWNFQTLSWGLFSAVVIAAEAVQYSSTSFFTSSTTSSDSCSSCLEYVLEVFISSNRRSLRGDARLILAQSLFHSAHRDFEHLYVDFESFDTFNCIQYHACCKT